MQSSSLIAKTFTYDDLFEYIKKNTALPEAINKVDLNADGPLALLKAIKAGDGNAEIFLHEDCDIYLLKLFKAEKIKPGEFLTAYDHLMADWNYRNTSTGVKFKIRSHRLVDEKGENLSDEGKKYIESVSERFKKILNVTVDREALTKQILALDPLEQSVIYLESKYRSSGKYVLLKDTADILPSVSVEKGDKTKIIKPGNFMEPPEEITVQEENLSFPSYSLQKYFCETYFEQPALQAAPRFGRISNETLWKMHKAGNHFYALYNKRVKSNLTSAHNRSEGPFSIAKHDEGHAVLGSLLSSDKRKIILEKHVPSLMQALKELETNFGQHSFGSRIFNLRNKIEDITFDQLNELTLYPFHQYTALSQQERMEKFIVDKAFDKLGTYYTITGGIESDLAYILLLMFHRDQNKELWEMITRHRKSLLDNPVIQALSLVAKAVAEQNNDAPLKADAKLDIKWDKWEKILREQKSSDAIWLQIESQGLGNDLVALITQAGLIYYHPFVPLTAEKQQALLEFIQTHSLNKKKQEEKTSSYSPYLFAQSSKGEAPDNMIGQHNKEEGKLNHSQ